MGHHPKQLKDTEGYKDRMSNTKNIALIADCTGCAG